MSARSGNRIDINEQRKHLNKLDQEIDQAIKGILIYSKMTSRT